MELEAAILLDLSSRIRTAAKPLNGWARCQVLSMCDFAEDKIRAGHFSWARRVLDNLVSYSGVRL